MNMCSSYISPINSTVNATFAFVWPEVHNRSSGILEDLLPFAWNISYTNNIKKTSKCPTKAWELSSFAINNAIVGILTPFLSRRTFIKWVTRSTFGVSGSKWWPLVSILVACINVFANFINAVLVKRSSGFSAPDIGTLVLLWATRPRLGFVATALVQVGKEASTYISVGVTTLLTEFILQSIGAVFMFKTLIFFAERDYLQPKLLQHVSGSWAALLLYAGTLIWIISITFFYVYVIPKFLVRNKVLLLTFQAIWNGSKIASMMMWKYLVLLSKIIWNGTRYVVGMSIELFRKCLRGGRNPDGGNHLDIIGEISAQPYPRAKVQAEEYVVKGWKGYLVQMGLGERAFNTVLRTCFVLLLPFWAQWMFWIGLVELYGDRYCVPVLWQMTVVWTVFELIGEVSF
ncbi:hypothetical protein EG329_012597 [Mollisiaceae sp. DMI_Dod_QoI]|nr:hypothetical protein EG329_012597 [Helotiales sp. DMI_Dod_QoI]